MDVIQLLINKGANLNIQDNDGYTALARICRDHNKDNLYTDIIKLLLDNGADINISIVGNLDIGYVTALTLARGNEDYVKLLLENKTVTHINASLALI